MGKKLHSTAEVKKSVNRESRAQWKQNNRESENIIIEKMPEAYKLFHIHNRKLRCLFTHSSFQSRVVLFSFCNSFSLLFSSISPTQYTSFIPAWLFKNSSLHSKCVMVERRRNLSLKFSCAHAASMECHGMFICSFDLFLSMRWFLL